MFCTADLEFARAFNEKLCHNAIFRNQRKPLRTLAHAKRSGVKCQT